MSYKAIFTILIVLAVTATLCISIMKPEMHKSVFVYNSDYAIEPKQEVIIENKQIPIMEQPASNNIKQVEFENHNIVTSQQIETSFPAQTEVKTVKLSPTSNIATKPITIQTTKTSNSKTNTQTQTNKNTTPQIDLQKIVQNNKEIQTSKNTISEPLTKTQTTSTSNTQTQFAPKPTVTIPKTTSQPAVQTQKVLTAKEEEIAWNIWRSNLTNKIMQDTNFPPVPAGVIFRYKFNVDKYGKITNVQTWSEDSKYTPYAIQYMAPVIRNLQGRSILIFPKGTARTATEAWGAWKISNRTIYSTPDNYNDIEKITK